MSNTLLLHIGMPKTGSTTLQKFLLTNNNILEKYGWRYPILSNDEIGDSERLDIEKCGNGYRMFEACTTYNNKSKWDKGLGIALNNIKSKNVIISSEHVYAYGTEKFIAGVKEKYENIKVIIYLRRQDRAIESLYNQWIKNGDEYRSFEKYLYSNDIPENLLEYQLKLDSISRIIGKENLIVRIYEKQQLIGNDIITDFLSVLGIRLNKDDWERSEPLNLSLRGNYLEINRLINSVQNINSYFGGQDDIWRDKNTKTDLCHACMRLSCLFNQDKSEYGFFSADERKKFLEKFTLDNEQIAREYLHREDGILFYDDRMDYPVFETRRDTAFEADMIRVFTTMVYVQNQRIKNLFEKKSSELLGKFLMKDVSKKSNNRGLLLFGAGHNCCKLLDILRNTSVDFIVDNDSTKQGMVLGGRQVKYAKDIKDWQEYFVIVTCEKTDEIEEQLRSFNLEKEEDYILIKDYGLWEY